MVASSFFTLPGCSVDGLSAWHRASISAVLRTDLADAAGDDLASFYKARGFRPVWTKGRALRPESRELVLILAHSEGDGLEPRRYGVPYLLSLLEEGRSGDPEILARAEIMLSRAFARYVLDLHQSTEQPGMVFTDPDMAPPPRTVRSVLEAATDAPSLRRHLIDLQRMHPLYEELRAGLASYRSRWAHLPPVVIPPGRTLAMGAKGNRVRLLRTRLGLAGDGAKARSFDDALALHLSEFQSAHGLTVTGKADPATILALNAGPLHYERLIVANLDRARALPRNPSPRSILVDAASAQLWLYEDGEPQDRMRVIVGRPGEQTPAMAGLIRFAVFNPYWNIPPDLARGRASHVLEQGPAYLRQEHLELLSDWSDAPRILDPLEVDWMAVAAGTRMLRVRQLPGPHNMMGAIKFMMPNPLGIYLHDTPNKAAFAGDDRSLSAGCVRVEDAARLARWLYRGKVPAPSGLPEQQVDLPRPVPVYITYLTARLESGGITFQKDIYNRDPTLLASIARRDQSLIPLEYPLDRQTVAAGGPNRRRANRG